MHSVEEAGGVPFITMELVEGQTLADLVPRDGFPLDRFFDIAIPVADAVAAVNLTADDPGNEATIPHGLRRAIRAPSFLNAWVVAST